MKRLLLIAAAIVIVLLLRPPGEVRHGPGEVAPRTPIQSEAELAPFSREDYNITPVADFDIEARVLGRKNYRVDAGAKLSPVDLALGWGPMSDETVLDQIDISQSGRFYRWRTDVLPIPRQEIEHNSANMHLIPANDAVEDQLKRLRKGQVVRIQGHLVNVDREDGWYWYTSQTRTDTGGGSCELVFVERVAVY